MKVYLYPADYYGCGHYRMVWPGEAALKIGADIVVIPPGDKNGLSVEMYQDKVHAVHVPEDADVMVFQRPSFPIIAQAIPHIRDSGIAVVVDIDDDLTAIHPSNPAWAMLHPASTTSHSWQAVSDACRAASLVTVSTPELVRRYSKGDAFVVRNGVPRRYFDVVHTDTPIVGWAGSTHSHPQDLAECGSIAGVTLNGERFIVIGDGEGAAPVLGLPEVKQTGPVEFGSWPQAVTQIGVGIAPLADTRFNRSKSWLKPLEYSAVGVPWVGSPLPEYERLHKLGCGMMVSKPREWTRELKRLITDETYRCEMSEAARAVAQTQVIEDHAHLWVEAWEEALRRERTRRPRTADTVHA
jgi:glycosyltransferase involved in cell wall biosynthesis